VARVPAFGKRGHHRAQSVVHRPDRVVGRAGAPLFGQHAVGRRVRQQHAGVAERRLEDQHPPPVLQHVLGFRGDRVRIIRFTAILVDQSVMHVIDVVLRLLFLAICRAAARHNDRIAPQRDPPASDSSEPTVANSPISSSPINDKRHPGPDGTANDEVQADGSKRCTTIDVRTSG